MNTSSKKTVIFWITLVVVLVAIIAGIIYLAQHFSSKSTSVGDQAAAATTKVAGQTQTVILGCSSGLICTTESVSPGATSTLSRVIVLADVSSSSVNGDGVVSAGSSGGAAGGNGTSSSTSASNTTTTNTTAQAANNSLTANNASSNTSSSTVASNIPNSNNSNSTNNNDNTNSANGNNPLNENGTSTSSAPSTPVTYTITASAGTHGSISPTGVISVNAGGSQSYTISPNSGYQINAVTIDGSAVTSAGTYTFTGIGINHTIFVTFTPLVVYGLTVSASGGSVSENPNRATFNAGDVVTLTATPADSTYQFVSWSGSFSGTANPATVTMNSNENIVANFTYVGPFNSSPSSGGTTGSTTGGTSGGTSGGTTGGSTGGTTGGTSGGTSGGTTGGSTGGGNGSGSGTTVTMYTITAIAGANGSISPSGVTVVNPGTFQTYTITPASNFQISTVLVDGVNQGPIAAFTFFDVLTNHTIAATFVRASQSSSGGGSQGGGSSGSSGGGGNQVNTSLQDNVTATPSDGVPSGSSLNQGLIAYYPFDGNGGDASGNGYTATLIHSPVFTTGVYSQAVEFNTAGAKYVILPNFFNYPSVATTSYALSVSLWFKSTVGDCPLFYEDNTGIAGIRLGTDNKIYASVFDHGSGDDEIVTSGTYADGHWHHVVDTYSGGTEMLYVDGALVGSQGGMWELGITGDPSARLGMGIVCGWPNGSCAYHWLDGGTIDDVRFYNRALTATEVMELYQGSY